MALSAVCSAFSSFIVYFANNKEGMQSIAYWLMGSLAGAKWENLAVIIPCVFIATLFFCTQSRILNMMLLGDEGRENRGLALVDPKVFLANVEALERAFRRKGGEEA